MPTENVKVSVDTLAMAINQGMLEVLLVKRKNEPFKSWWALPGGILQEEDDSLESAVARELFEQTNVANVYLEQLYTFGDRNRDPRGRVISIAYMALLREDIVELKTGAEASGLAWWPINDLPALAFDHDKIIAYGYQRLKYKVEYSPAAFKLLPEKFTLRELQDAYEAILGRKVDNRNFRKKFLSSKILIEQAETSRESSFRPAKLYSFSEENFDKLPDRPVFLF